MLKLARLGVKVVPAMPAFYNHPSTTEDLISHHVMKLLDQFGIRHVKGRRWNGGVAARRGRLTGQKIKA
jgi:4-hydroxy-3-polyprenylbenzoate decarboxylase